MHLFPLLLLLAAPVAPFLAEEALRFAVLPVDPATPAAVEIDNEVNVID